MRDESRNPWTIPGTVERLKELITAEAGKKSVIPSFGQIAGILSREGWKYPDGVTAVFTRNSIAGKVDRMGLAQPGTFRGDTVSRAQRDKERAKVREARKEQGAPPPKKDPQNLSVSDNKSYLMSYNLDFRLSNAKQPDPDTYPFEENPKHGMPLLDSTLGIHCKWPIGQKEADLIVCGCAPVNGKSYCSDHLRMSKRVNYVKQADRNPNATRTKHKPPAYWY